MQCRFCDLDELLELDVPIRAGCVLVAGDLLKGGAITVDFGGLIGGHDSAPSSES